jgi:chemotaxis signal transduction protein
VAFKDMKRAQGIICGSWALAFSFEWARQIVEEYEVSAIPKAPHWLLGSANIEGNIVPVIDLALYFSPATASLQASSRRRLLVGGITVAGAEDALALVFDGLPQQLNYEAQELTFAGALPPKLREVCDAVASDKSGCAYMEINVDKLLAVLADELSLS